MGRAELVLNFDSRSQVTLVVKSRKILAIATEFSLAKVNASFVSYSKTSADMYF